MSLILVALGASIAKWGFIAAAVLGTVYAVFTLFKKQIGVNINQIWNEDGVWHVRIQPDSSLNEELWRALGENVSPGERIVMHKKSMEGVELIRTLEWTKEYDEKALSFSIWATEVGEKNRIDAAVSGAVGVIDVVWTKLKKYLPIMIGIIIAMAVISYVTRRKVAQS